MAAGLGDQIEGRLTNQMVTHWGAKPWGRKNWSLADPKARKLRRERRRAKHDPECLPQYRRYHGWEW